jgi:hypothetical protein
MSSQTSTICVPLWKLRSVDEPSGDFLPQFILYITPLIPVTGPMVPRFPRNIAVKHRRPRASSSSPLRIQNRGALTCFVS